MIMSSPHREVQPARLGVGSNATLPAWICGAGGSAIRSARDPLARRFAFLTLTIC